MVILTNKRKRRAATAHRPTLGNRTGSRAGADLQTDDSFSDGSNCYSMEEELQRFVDACLGPCAAKEEEDAKLGLEIPREGSRSPPNLIRQKSKTKGLKMIPESALASIGRQRSKIDELLSVSKEFPQEGLKYLEKSRGSEQSLSKDRPPFKDSSRPCINGFLHPQGFYKIRWDLLVGIAIMYSVVMEPFYIAFSYQGKPGSVTDVLDWITTTLFFLDIIVSFRTAYLDARDELVTHTGKVIWKYIFGWFPLDFLSTFPFQSLNNSHSHVNVGSSTKLLRVLRLFRLIRLVRLVKLSNTMERTSESFVINPNLLGLLKMFLQLAFIGHLLGCVWMFVGLQNHNEGVSWMKAKGIQDGSINLKYVVSIYYAFTTMTTVGYGDVVGTNDAERGLSIFLLFLGATVFGLVLGHISVLIENYDRKGLSLTLKMDKIKEFLLDKRISSRLSKRLVKHFRRYYEKVNPTDMQLPMEQIMEHLPIAPACMVILARHRETLDQLSSLEGHPPMFVVKLVEILRPFSAEPGEIIFLEQEIGTHIFFMGDGNVEMFYKIECVSNAQSDAKFEHSCEQDETAGLKQTELCFFDTVIQGRHFGEAPALLGILHPVSAAATTYSDLYSAQKFPFLHILVDHFPDIKDEMVADAKQFQQEVSACRSRRCNIKPVSEIINRRRKESDAEVYAQLFSVSKEFPSISTANTPNSTCNHSPVRQTKMGTFSNSPRRRQMHPKSFGDIPSLAEFRLNAPSIAMKKKRAMGLKAIETLEEAGRTISVSSGFDTEDDTIEGQFSPRSQEKSPKIKVKKEKDIELKAVVGVESTERAKSSLFEETTEDISLHSSNSRSQENALKIVASKQTDAELKAAVAVRTNEMSKSTVSEDISEDKTNSVHQRQESMRRTSSVTTREFRRQSLIFDHEQRLRLKRTISQQHIKRFQSQKQNPLGKWNFFQQPVLKRVLNFKKRKRKEFNDLDPGFDQKPVPGRLLSPETIPPKLLFAKTGFFHPNSTFKGIWDMAMCLFIIYSVIECTYRLSFNADSKGAWLLMDYAIDLVFACDMIITFRTAIWTDTCLELKQSRIALAYLRSWFLPDLASTIPFDLFLSQVATNRNVLRSTKLLRAIRLVRLLRIVRLIKMSKIIKKYEDVMPIHPAVFRVLKYIFMMCFAAHLYACLFYAVGLNASADQSTWIENYCVHNWGDSLNSICLSELGLASRYIAAVYWAVTTMTTVGYGDIVPHIDQKSEIICAFITQVTASSIFAYVVNGLINIVGNFSLGDRYRKLAVEEIDSTLQETSLCQDTRRLIRSHYNYYIQSKPVYIMEQQDFLDLLPPALQIRVVRQMYQRHLPCLPIFNRMDLQYRGFLAVVLPSLKPCLFRSGDPIICRYFSAPEMFFVVDGTCVANEMDAPHKIIRYYSAGQYFGELTLMDGFDVKFELGFTVDAVTSCRMYGMDKNAFRQLQDYKHIFRSFYRLVMEESLSTYKAT